MIIRYFFNIQTEFSQIHLSSSIINLEQVKNVIIAYAPRYNKEFSKFCTVNLPQLPRTTN